MQIVRKSLDECTQLISNFPVVGIVGPRQVGKTYLVNLLKKKLIKETIYLDLELDSDIQKLKDPQFFLEQYANKTVILDEVQRLKSLYPLIRALVDQNRVPGRFVLLGSASPELIRDVSESLAGRIAYIEIPPITINEISTELSQNELWLRGGFPLSVVAQSTESAQTWMRYFVKSYIERDLPLLGLQVSPIQIERLWKMLAHLNGQVLNTSDIANSLGITSNTAKRYIDFMESAYLIRRVYPIWANLKKRIVKAPKVFLRDSGILHHLLNILTFEDLLSHPSAGHSWEAFVVQQIAANLPVNMEMYHYRTHNGSEVDLVLNKGISTAASIEIKLSDAPHLSRGNTIAFEDLKAPMNFVITPSSDNYLIKEKVRVCSLKAFILDYLPKL